MLIDRIGAWFLALLGSCIMTSILVILWFGLFGKEGDDDDKDEK